jgi:hypothetical protein
MQIDRPILDLNNPKQTTISGELFAMRMVKMTGVIAALALVRGGRR